ncbi:MAG: hypothetical protein ACXVCP_03465 [Bdellovibrio sp.]
MRETNFLIFSLLALALFTGCTEVAPQVSCLFGCNEATSHEYAQNDGSLNFKGRFLAGSEVHFYEDGNEIPVQPTIASNTLKIVPVASSPQQLKTSAIYKLVVSSANASGTSTFTLPAGSDSTVLGFARVAPPVCGATEKLNFNSVSNTFTCETLNISWNQLTNVPTTFAPNAHNHPISDVTNLQTTLDSKASAQDVLDLQSREQLRGERFRYSFPSGVKAYYMNGLPGNLWYINYSGKNFAVNIGNAYNAPSIAPVPYMSGGSINFLGNTCYFTSSDCSGSCLIHSAELSNPFIGGYIKDFAMVIGGKILEFTKSTPWSATSVAVNSSMYGNACSLNTFNLSNYFIPNSITGNLPDVSGSPTLESY